ncbi:MAG: hemolysin family protein [Xanthomonadaceae bacterium]|jgi:putative hemolysin|nr:hemolysin family protein [Xanthomonadaceae bacterium]
MVELLIVFALILLNGFFAMSEMAVMTSRKSRLKQMAQTSRRGARALTLSEKPENFLSTVQIGITLIGILTGLFGGEAFGLSIAAWIKSTVPASAPYANTVGIVIAVVLITFLTLIFGELVPKRLAIARSERIASHVALPMSWLAWIAAPIVSLLAASTRLVLNVLRLNKNDSAAITEEEIRLLVAEGHEQGVIDIHERDMMNRVMRLGDRTAESLMTPRNRIAWLDIAASLPSNLNTMREQKFSRYPVYRNSDQDVVGILEAKSLFTQFSNRSPNLFGDLRKPLFVSDSTHSMKLLKIFKEEQQSMALVVDEYGDIQGIVTTNDLMGAVVGRQAFDIDDGDPPIVIRENGSILVDGTLPIDDLRDVMGDVDLPNGSDGDYNTLAGMCIEHFGRIPHAGEYFDWAGWRIEVVDLDGVRVDKLLLQKLTGEEGNDLVV